MAAPAPGQHQQGEGDLAGNQRVVGPAPATPRVVLRVFDCITWLTSGRESWRAGHRPNRIPCADGNRDAEEEHRQVDLNGGFVRKREFRQIGDDDADGLVCQAKPRPAPVSESSSDSVSNWRTMRSRLAPMAERMANS